MYNFCKANYLAMRYDVLSATSFYYQRGLKDKEFANYCNEVTLTVDTSNK